MAAFSKNSDMRKTIRCILLGEAVAGLFLLTSCTEGPSPHDLKEELPEQTPRGALLSKERVVFMCQHPQGRAIIPDELRAHADVVDVISPMWFDIHSDGSIQTIFEELDWEEYLTFCRDAGIAVLPVFRNFKPKEFLLNPDAMDRAILEIAALLEAEGFEGLMIDIEEDSSDERTTKPMLSFLERLHTKMQEQGRLLSVSFNPVYWGRGWQTAEILSRCDWAFSMFYDYSGPWNKKNINATAPYEWPERNQDIRRDVERIMTQENARKIIFGIPAYGNRVTLNSDGECVDFTVAYVNTFLAERDRVGAPREWDPLARTPRFEYETEEGRHIIWYEDKESYTWRMKMACELDAPGVGIWSIGARGGLDADIWKVLQAYRDGRLCSPSEGTAN